MKNRRKKQFKGVGESRGGLLLAEVALWKQGFVSATPFSGRSSAVVAKLPSIPSKPDII